MEQVLAAGEISAAKFDPATKSFTNVQALTDNATLDTQPKAAVSEGNALVTWVGNASNDIFGTDTENSILCSTLTDGTWSAPQTLQTDLNAVVGTAAVYLDGKPAATYITDQDNDLQTIEDRDLTVLDLTGNETVLVSGALVSNPQYAAILGTPSLTWYQNGNIRTTADLTETNDLFDAPQSTLPDSYAIAENATGQTAIVYGSTEEGVGGIYGRLHDEETGWSQPLLLAQTGDTARFVNGIYDDNGQLYLAFNRAKVTFLDEEQFSETNDLCTLKFTPESRMVLHDVYHSDLDVMPGQSLPLYLDVENTGHIDVEGLRVDITANGSSVASFDIDSPILRGERVEWETAFTLPETIAQQTDFIVTVTPKGETDPIGSQTITLGLGNLSLNLGTHYDGDTLVTSVNVQNSGFYPLDTTLLVRTDSMEKPVDFTGNIC